MDNIDLNFLNESEVKAIVSVIEKDFELKAAEKSRLCRLRKTLIRNDQRAVELSQSNFDGFGCVICFHRFVFLINPKRICCSCNLQICNSCCQYIKTLQNYVCNICRQQKDLIAMNCSWFYENIRRKFMDGGSQIVANSLSDYPRKNLISPTILNMVKGTQITKFRHQVEEATRTIEESLIKVEISFQERDLKSIKFADLIQKFIDTLKQIFRNTSQVLYITLENYLYKIGKKNTNIEVEVFSTLHEEVELLTGKKIDVKNFKKNLLKKRKADLDGEDSFETILSMPIVDKLISDVQQSLLEGQGKEYDDLNCTLQSMVKKPKYDTMDFEFESISQVPSRQGTIRRSIHVMSPQPTLFEYPQSVSNESLQSGSRLYSLSGVGSKSNAVSKQWNELMANSNGDLCESMTITQENLVPPDVSLTGFDTMPIDSDAISMHAVNDTLESNWLMKARFPLGSLNSLCVESCDPYSNRPTKRLMNSNRSDVLVRSISIDGDIDKMCRESRRFLDDSNNLDIDNEYRGNLQYVARRPSTKKSSQLNESGESQDSGIVTHVPSQQTLKPAVPSRKSRIPQTSTPVATPQIPRRKIKPNSKPILKATHKDSSSDSSISDGVKKIPLTANQKRNLSDQLGN